MKKPSIIQIIFAKKWLWGLAFWGFPVIIGVVILMPFFSKFDEFLDFVIAFISVAAIAVFSNIILSFGLFEKIAKINGAPFCEGDMVYIIAGKHKGKTVSVYEIWKDRKQVRVDLGEQAKKDVKDVYSYIEVCRAYPT